MTPMPVPPAPTDWPAPSTPLGEQEIADLLGVVRSTCHQWAYRGVLPPADFVVNGMKAWKASTIRRWAKDTGRL